MNKVEKILDIIADIMEVDVNEIDINTELNEDIWDSLAVVTYISEVDSTFEQIISPVRVSSAKTVSDLVDLVK
jgi:acyl carrier protein